MKKPNEPQVQPPAERDPNIKASVKIKSRIDKVTDPESSRFALAHVQATPRNEDEVYLTATNGRTLVVVPAHGYVDQERLIPQQMLLKKKPGRMPHVASLNGRWESTDGKFAVEPEGRFPRCDDVIADREHPQPAVNNPDLKWAGPSVQVRLDPRLLLEMAEAMNETEQGVTLFLRADKNGMVETSINVLGENGFGVLMPCSVSKRDGELFDERVAEYKKPKSAAKRGVMPWEQEEEAPEEAPVVAEEPAQAA